MEITSFILGVCAVIIILMVAGTSVNYMTIKVLRKDIDNLDMASSHSFEDTYRQLEKLQQEVYSRIDTVEQNTVRHTDSRADKLGNKLDELDNRLMGEISILLQDMRSLRQEISRVEKSYKEKINY
jgi:predicted  nucleic acid-binding Zn-ribbon protein